MRAFPAALERLTEQFARLPGIGMKSAQRLAFYVLSLPKDEAQSFAQAILDAKDSVRLCPVCQNLTDQELCAICADRHGAGTGIPRRVPCAAWRHFAPEPRRAGRSAHP